MRKGLSYGRNGMMWRLIARPYRMISWLLIRLAYALRLKQVPVLPLWIDIEPNNTCNFKCAHCHVTYWDKKPAYFNQDTFTQVLQQLPNLMKVKLQGMGEPLLNKDLIPMLQAGEARSIQMHFHTNGSIGDKDKAAQLVQLQNTHITYSLDGATAATFEQVRAGSRFDRIVENILTLTKLRHLQSKLLISAWTVVTQKNISELPQIVQLAKKLGLDYIAIQPHLTNWGKTEMTDRTDEIQVATESALFAQQLAAARSIAATEGIDLLINESNRFSRNKPCSLPWNTSYIAANGDVVPCCVIADADVVKMGNVFETDFKEIWNAPAYQTLREQIASHNLPDHCKHCYLN
jgi:radical SAM protein with 4Fe4S-binding SPASM domain